MATPMGFKYVTFSNSLRNSFGGNALIGRQGVRAKIFYGLIWGLEVMSGPEQGQLWIKAPPMPGVGDNLPLARIR